MLNTASFTRSAVGRVAVPAGVFRFTPLAFPLMTRIVYGSANARDLRSLCSAIQNLPKISELISGCNATYLKVIYKNIDILEDIHSLIENAIVEEPPFTIREGGMIKPGYNEELDIVTNDMNNSKDILAQIEAEQREATGIPKLKVGYNRVFGPGTAPEETIAALNEDLK